MLVVRESQKFPGIRYLTSVNERGEENPAGIASDFEKLLREQGVEPPAKPENVLPPAAYDPQAPSITRRELTREEIAELASNYDPTNMTDEEYDSFLEKLVEKGVLNENELGPIGYHGWVLIGSLTECGDGADFRIGYGTPDRTNVNWSTYGNNWYAINFGEAKGNALVFAKYQSLYKPAGGSAGWLSFANKRYDTFVAMADVLDAMQRQRQCMGLY